MTFDAIVAGVIGSISSSIRLQFNVNVVTLNMMRFQGSFCGWPAAAQVLQCKLMCVVTEQKRV